MEPRKSRIGRLFCWLGLHDWDDHIIAMSCKRCDHGKVLTFHGWRRRDK